MKSEKEQNKVVEKEEDEAEEKGDVRKVRKQYGEEELKGKK